MNDMKKIKICPHCGKPVIKSELPEYVWQCLDCDEDFYNFECLDGFDEVTDYVGREVYWEGKPWIIDNCDVAFKDEDEQTSFFLIPIVYQNPELYDEAFKTGKLEKEGYWVRKTEIKFDEETEE